MTPNPNGPIPENHAVAPSVLDGAVRACRRSFVGIGAFSFVINALVLTVPVYMIQVFDRVMTSRSLDTLLVLTIAALLAFAVMAVLDIIRSRMLVRIGVWLDITLGRQLLAEAFGGGRDGSAQAVRDLAQVRGFLTGPGIFAILDAPWVPLFVALVFLLHPVLGLTALIGAGALFALAYANEVATRGRLTSANAAWSDAIGSAETVARQSESVAGLGMIGMTAARWANAGAHAVAAQAEASDRAGVFSALGRFIRLALQIVVLGLAASLVVGGEITPGAMIAASIMIARALAPVEQAIGIWRQLVGARSAFGRVRTALERAAGQGPWMPLPRPEGRLEIADIAYTPSGAEAPLFENLTVTVKPGEMLGVTGPSGAGKSTLARMLVGVAVPDRGRVRLDGVDLASWPADERGRHIGYVPQCVELLPGTVGENIARFTDAPPEAIIEAAQRARLHELIIRLPNGYDTRVGGPSDLLSAGARQRVALARALFGDPRLLIFDEPYSNLDTAGVEALVAAIVDARAAGAAVIMVAHRPSILAHADAVLRIEDRATQLVTRNRPTPLSVVPATEPTVDGETAEKPAPRRRTSRRKAGGAQ